ncbi:hypothetical protein CLU79DRAFT_404196 [Phycomyces nitens]|nr:hypothetical protein CLU79DRAFT_404196 [Phycomyces nitens]
MVSSIQATTNCSPSFPLGTELATTIFKLDGLLKHLESVTLSQVYWNLARVLNTPTPTFSVHGPNYQNNQYDIQPDAMSCPFTIPEPLNRNINSAWVKQPFTYLTNSIESDQHLEKQIKQRARSRSGPSKIDCCQETSPTNMIIPVHERPSQKSTVLLSSPSPKENIRPRVKRTRSCSDSYSSLDMDGLNKLSLALDMCSGIGTSCDSGIKRTQEAKFSQKHVWGAQPRPLYPLALDSLDHQDLVSNDQPSDNIKDFNESIMESLRHSVPLPLSISTTPSHSVYNSSLFGYSSDMSPTLSTGNIPYERQPTTMFEETEPAKEENNILWVYNEPLRQNSYQDIEDGAIKVDELKREISCDLYTSIAPNITPYSSFSSPLPWTNPPAYNIQKVNLGQYQDSMVSTADSIEDTTKYLSSYPISPQETSWENTTKGPPLYSWGPKH